MTEVTGLAGFGISTNMILNEIMGSLYVWLLLAFFGVLAFIAFWYIRRR